MVVFSYYPLVNILNSLCHIGEKFLVFQLVSSMVIGYFIWFYIFRTHISYLKWNISFITACLIFYYIIYNLLHNGCLIRSRNCLPLTSTWIHPQFLVGSIMLIFLVFCVVFLSLFVFVICLVYPMLPVSVLSILDCPFGFL